jgi:hypothetical protein
VLFLSAMNTPPTSRGDDKAARRNQIELRDGNVEDAAFWGVPE